MHFSRARAASGMSLVDVIVGIALFLVIFLALFGVLRASIILSALAKAKAAATEIAQNQMEYLRGLSYDSLGTVGGIPSGNVPEYATTTEDGIAYPTHTFIEYVDDPADGTGSNDTNGITTDYKRARVAVSYTIGTRTNSVVLVSNFAPPGIESSGGGGTLEINVVDAKGNPVSGASVHITNASTSPTVNVTAYSDSDGIVFLPGAATSTQYQVVVSKSGYSTAQTYVRDTTNQNPNPGYLTVTKDTTTTQTFAIDLLSTFNLTTFSPLATSTFADSFADNSKLSSMSSTTVSGGSLTLASGANKGSAVSVATTSPYLIRWGQASATTTGGVKIHIYDGSGALVPDSVLSGNANGFNAFPVSLAGISTSTYPSLSIGATLSGTSTVPTVSHWSLSYAAGPTPLPNAPFTLTGSKTIGSQGNGTPIYKTIISATTSSDGTQGLILEWDGYALSTPGHDVIDACPSPPYSLSPGTTLNATLTLGPSTSNSLRVLVTDSLGNPVSGASVTLSRTGFSETETSSACGSAYFGGIPKDTDYTVAISKTGYTAASFTGVAVSGETTYGASFP